MIEQKISNTSDPIEMGKTELDIRMANDSFEECKSTVTKTNEISIKIKTGCIYCGSDVDVRVIDGTCWCKKCRKGW